MTKAIHCQGLGKQYRSGTVALDSLDFEVEKGTIHGLVGRNGAGKTTLMKCLVNLIKPTRGTVSVLGQPVGRTMDCVGALIEAPAFYPHLTARKNLELFAGYFGAGSADCDRVLNIVGLTSRADDKTSRYSLGMKQRLGIAIALLGTPELLILDEPVNGLDPEAIAEIRGLMRSLRDEGTTILLSSHLLGEIEQVCDVVTVLEAGRLVATGSPEQLRARFNGEAPVELQVSNVTRTGEILEGLGVRAEVEGPVVLAYLREGQTPSEVVKALVQADVDVVSINRRDSLEAAYLAMTRKEQ